MRRWKKRNHKFWAIVRAKSNRNYGRKRHSGGLRIHGVLKKYHNKGHFDPVAYANEHTKGLSGLAGLKAFWDAYKKKKYPSVYR